MSYRILVMDSDSAMSELWSQTLKKYNFDTSLASTSPEAIRLLFKNSPDAVIYNLPGQETDNWKLCRDIRKFSNVPLIVLSTVKSPEMTVGALDAGADDYLVKPVSTCELVAHLRRFTRRTAWVKMNRHFPEARMASLLA